MKNNNPDIKKVVITPTGIDIRFKNSDRILFITNTILNLLDKKANGNTNIKYINSKTFEKLWNALEVF